MLASYFKRPLFGPILSSCSAFSAHRSHFKLQAVVIRKVQINQMEIEFLLLVFIFDKIKY